MKKLKTILQCNWIFYLLFFIISMYVTIYVLFPRESRYDINTNNFKCIITDIYIDGNYLKLSLNGKEKLVANYYFKDETEKLQFMENYRLGDVIYIKGNLTVPNKNTNLNLFNYKQYLYYEQIYYVLEIHNYKKIANNKTIIYTLKNKIISRIEKFDDCKSYLYALILGEDRYLDDKVINDYQSIGISHLFAISGMHISIISGILLFIFKKIHLNEKISYLFIMVLLMMYLFITGVSPSILRAVIFFILISINKLFKLNIKISNLFLLAISIILCLSPCIIFKVGFQFSVVTSYSLIVFSVLINKSKNYFHKLFLTSFVAFMSSLPISIYHFNQINILGFLYNLFFVPLMTFVLFPLSIIAFILPVVSNILFKVIKLMEIFANICAMIPSSFIFTKMSCLMVFIYFVFVFLILKKTNKKTSIIFVGVLLVHYNYNYIFNTNKIMFLDVGQGDSILLQSGGNSMLIDTGGKIHYEMEEWEQRSKKNNISTNVLIPMLKSLGIRKVNNLILTHGDYDHMGEAINLVENFKVEKVIFNCGDFNELEQELIQILNKKKIPYYSCIKELNIDGNKLYFLNNKDYGNENDNSSVVYTELNSHKFLFMGDVGVEVEEDLIEKYNLKDIEVLKVGHHGSKTSSGKEFIKKINPKYSIISVGKNNRYGHPNTEVLDNLESSKIYRTDQDGSIMFKIKNNKLQIETCTP